MKAPFRILKFYTKYVTRGGEHVPVDMVDICGHGMAQSRVTPHVIGQISNVRPDGDVDNPAWAMSKLRWDYIKPHYQAWKEGQELPASGTPLAAWPGVTPEQAEVLKGAGFRSVEDIAHATDSVIARIPMPGIRDLANQARLFLDNKDSAHVAAALVQKDKEMAELREQLEEMRQLVLSREPELAEDGSELPRRRGRPAKVQPTAEQAV